MSTSLPGPVGFEDNKMAKQKNMHPFFASQPPFRVSKTAGRSKTSLLDLPAEIRVLIYTEAMIFSCIIDKHPFKHRNNRAARLPDGKLGARITDAFNLMHTCKTIYRESQQIFWSENTFLIHTAPEYGIWPRPDVRGNLAHHSALINDCKWRVKFAIESAESQQMIRKLAWVFPSDPWEQMFGRWIEHPSKTVKFEGSDRIYANLLNVDRLVILMDVHFSLDVHAPQRDEVEALIQKGHFDPELLTDLEETRIQKIMSDAETFRTATRLSVDWLTRNVFPKIETVSFAGSEDLSQSGQDWYGKPLTAFPPDSLYMKSIEKELEGKGYKVEYAGVGQTAGTGCFMRCGLDS